MVVLPIGRLIHGYDICYTEASIHAYHTAI
jgi:hypothetical protein